MMRRRGFLGGSAAATLAAGPAVAAQPMYGLIGKMLARPGQRDALIGVLAAEIDAMPGCLSYIVAADTKDPDAIWITEAWDSAASHRASLKLASVQATIAKARPLIAGFAERFETIPVGGAGLKP